MNVFKSLGAKLFFLAITSIAVAILPCVYVAKSCSRKIEKCNEQMKVVELLGSVSVLADGMYLKVANKPIDKQKIQEATTVLHNFYETLPTKNVKAKPLFAKSALSLQRKNMARDNSVAEIANFITEKSFLLSDHRLGIRLLLDVSGITIPSIESETIAFRYFLGEKEKNSNVVLRVNRILAQTRAVVVRLSGSSTSTEYKIQPEVFEKLNKLNSQVVKIERIVAQYNSSGSENLQLVEAIDLFASATNELWVAVNKNLAEMLENKLSELVRQTSVFWVGFALIILVLATIGLLIGKSIIKGVESITSIVKVASTGEVLKAKSVIETTQMSPTYFELNESVKQLVLYTSEIIEASRNIANASSRINLMLNGMNTTKVPMLASIKNSFVEVDKQIKSDYDFVLREVALLTKCAEQITNVEKQLKNAKKLGAVLKENNQQISDNSAEIIAHLTNVISTIDKISNISATMKDSAERVNLLGLNLAVIAKKMGKDSAGTDTISNQIRLVSQQLAVAVVDIVAMCSESSELLSEAMNKNSKIIEISDLSGSSATEIDSSSVESLKVASDIGSELNSVASALRSNISTGLSFDEPERDLDDIRDTIKNMSTIVKKASDSVEALRSKLR